MPERFEMPVGYLRVPGLKGVSVPVYKDNERGLELLRQQEERDNAQG